MSMVNVSSLPKRLLRKAGLSRNRLAAGRLLAERLALGAAGLPRRSVAKGGRILCYHSIGQPEYGVNDVSPSRFRRQIDLALRLGFGFVPARTIAEGKGEHHDLAITFDDATSSCIAAAAPILSEYSIPWTLFVVAGWSDSAQTGTTFMRWSDIGQLRDQNIAIGSHSVTHPDFSSLGDERIEEELTQSRQIIHRRLGVLTDEFAIPFGQSRNWNAACQSAALLAGYRHVYAQSWHGRTAGTVPRSFVTRFDGDFIFKSLLHGAYDDWEEWY